MSPGRGSTPRQTDWLTVSCNVTLTLTLTLASVNIGQSRLHLRYGTRLRSHQEDSSAASLHRQPATARAPPASRSATASSLRTLSTTGSARAHRSACRTRRYPVSSQSPCCNKRRPSVRQPASRPQPPGCRKEARALASSLQHRLETNGPF
jgi:hypothetical protein